MPCRRNVYAEESGRSLECVVCRRRFSAAIAWIAGKTAVASWDTVPTCMAASPAGSTSTHVARRPSVVRTVGCCILNYTQ